MPITLKLVEIGDSVGVELPKEVLAAMRLGESDTLYLTETPEGFRLTPYDPALEEQQKQGREFMRDFRDAFHELGK